MSENVCPVCGFSALAEPAYDDGLASFEICPCCGTEFGYDDASVSHDILRERWIAAGYPWWAPEGPPSDWRPETQLMNIAPGL